MFNESMMVSEIMWDFTPNLQLIPIRFYFYLLKNITSCWSDFFLSKLSLDFFQDVALVPDFLNPLREYWWFSNGESQDING